MVLVDVFYMEPGLRDMNEYDTSLLLLKLLKEPKYPNWDH